jgi:hypothetical protein
MVTQIDIEKSKLVLRIPSRIVGSWEEGDLDVTLLVDNWDEWEVSIERDELNPTFKATSFPFKFVKEAKTWLLEEYLRFKHDSVAYVLLVPRNPDGSYAPASINYDVDFSTVNNDDDYFEVNCRTIDLRTIVKQKGGTEFTFDVDTIADSKTLLYRGVELDNVLRLRRAEMSKFMAEAADLTYWDNGVLAPMGLSFGDSEVFVKDVIEYKAVEAGIFNDIINVEHCIKALKDITLGFKYISDALAYTFVKLFGSEGERDTQAAYTSPAFKIYVNVYTPDGTLYSSLNVELGYETQVSTTVSGAITRYALAVIALKNNYKDTIINSDVFVPKNHVVKVFSKYERTNFRRSGFTDSELCFAGVGTLSVTYTRKQDSITPYKCITLKNLLTRLFNQMGVQPVINDKTDGIYYRNVFVAAENIASNAGAKLYCSYDEIERFLMATGRTVLIVGNTLTIDVVDGSDGAFPPYVLPDLEFSEEETADLRISPNNDMIYSTIKIGYKTTNIEGINKFREYNVERVFTTFTNSKKTLDLTTSIRADSVGFAIMACEKQKEKRDNKDLFVIECEEGVGNYLPKLVDASIPSSDYRFNLAFSPDVKLGKWFPVIGAFADVFTSNGTNEESYTKKNHFCFREDVHIDSVILDIATSDNKTVVSLAGVPRTVAFSYKGIEYTGYIKELRENPLARQQVEMKLIATAPDGGQEFARKAKGSIKDVTIQPFGETIKVKVDFSGAPVTIADVTPQYSLVAEKIVNKDFDDTSWWIYSDLISKMTFTAASGIGRIEAKSYVGTSYPGLYKTVLTVGKTYTYNIYIRSDGTNAPVMKVGGNTIIGTLSQSWQHYSGTVVASSNLVQMYMGVTNPNGTEFFEVDTYSITEAVVPVWWTQPVVALVQNNGIEFTLAFVANTTGVAVDKQLMLRGTVPDYSYYIMYTLNIHQEAVNAAPTSVLITPSTLLLIGNDEMVEDVIQVSGTRVNVDPILLTALDLFKHSITCDILGTPTAFPNVGMSLFFGFEYKTNGVCNMYVFGADEPKDIIVPITATSSNVCAEIEITFEAP